MKRFKYIFRVITTVILLNLTASGASAQSIDYDSIEVSLLTCSPGQEVWAQYGHTALRWHDLNPEHCIDVVVNYGVFSSSQPYFIPRFIFGLTDYCVGALPYDEFYKEYSYEGRGIVEQVLNLTTDDKKAIQDALNINLRPENQTYRYNFFYDNCTSRARDMIVDHLHGKVKYADKADAKVSYRDMIHRWTGDYPWCQFGEDLLLGVNADMATTRTQQQFLPDNLRDDFEKATYNGKPFVKETKTLLEPENLVDYQVFISPFTLFFFVFVISYLIVIYEYNKKKILWGWDALMMIAAGLPGIVLTIMVFSQHPCVSLNLLILFGNPIPLFMLWRATKRTRRHEHDIWWKVWLVMIILGFLGGFIQHYPTPILFMALSLLSRPLVHIYMERAGIYKA